MTKKATAYQPKNYVSTGQVIFGVVVLLIAAALLPSIKSGYNSYLAKSSGGKGSPAVEAIRAKNAAMAAVNIEYTKQSSATGAVLILDLTINNTGKQFIKDVEVTCDSKGNSGTKIDTNKRVIYEAVAPEFHKTVKGFNMGFLAAQATETNCRVTDLVVF